MTSYSLMTARPSGISVFSSSPAAVTCPPRDIAEAVVGFGERFRAVELQLGAQVFEALRHAANLAADGEEAQPACGVLVDEWRRLPSASSS